MSAPFENLKAIRFEGELLPNWAQLLDLAARLSPVSEGARQWFSRLTTCAGVDDARTVIEYCRFLRASIQQHRESLAMELRRGRDDVQPSHILKAWLYALDTMIQQAESAKTCSWSVENADNVADSEGGDFTFEACVMRMQVNNPTAPNPATAPRFQVERHGRRVGEPESWKWNQ